MIEVSFLIIGLIVGFVLAWFISKANTSGTIAKIKEDSKNDFTDLDKEYSSYKAKKEAELDQLQSSLTEMDKSISEKNITLETNQKTLSFLEKEIALTTEKHDVSKKIIEEKEDKLIELVDEVKNLNEQAIHSDKANATLEVEIKGLAKTLIDKDDTLKAVNKKLELVKSDFDTVNNKLATANATNTSLTEKLATQKKEIEEMGERFNAEFKNIAAEILKDNTKSFSEVNETKIKALLNPLGENLNEFKKKVEDVYDKEAKERFSLEEKVKELAEKSDKISQDAINLTNALKGEAKTQGNWGEMILESILEKSGLRKDEEYFLEHQLLDDDGKPLRSDSENKKMRPDAVIKYPDNRNVIIDSKVSLNAYTRYMGATDVTEQEKELEAHIGAIKNHIISLSTKGYDDYDKALDFVMMFVPSEPAYIAAMQGDVNLWNFAYDKRILLMNPTNLITSLKLIVDLWKREYQNQNAITIADRGAKLYDKFVGFVSNLEKVGKYIDSAQSSYDEAYKQLSTGNDNLVLQSTKLKELGVKNKKELTQGLVSNASVSVLTE